MLGALRKIQIGKETTLGTEVNATSILRVEGEWNDETERVFPPEDVGVAGGVGRNYVAYKTGTLPYAAMPLNFEQLGYFLNMGIEGVAPVRDGGAGTLYVSTYTIPHSASVSPYTYTIEDGDEQQAYVFTGCFCESITISGEFGGPLMMQPVIRCIPGGQTTFTAGQAIPSVTEAKFGLTKLYVDAVGDGWGTTQKTGTFNKFELKLENIQKVKDVSNGNSLGYVATKMGENFGNITLTYTAEHDSLSVAEDTARAAGTARAIRIIAAHDTATATPATYTYKTLILDICGKYSNTMKLEKQDGNILATHTLKGHYDSTLTSKGVITLVNELSALP